MGGRDGSIGRAVGTRGLVLYVRFLAVPMILSNVPMISWKGDGVGWVCGTSWNGLARPDVW